jgi:hypothetical protein
MQKVEVQQMIAAPVRQVWERYTDHVSWSEWAGMGRVRLDREGVPPPNGVGCVRAIGPAVATAFEEILSFEIPQRMTYRVIRGGIPIKDHLGEVLFEAQGDATLITWRCRFNSRVPGLGPFLRVLVSSLFRRALASLARDQEAH